MVSSITSGGARRMELGGSAHDHINAILKQIKTLRKRAEQLQKQMLNETDPAVRLQLSKEIIDVERTIQLLERQIMQIEEAERRRAKAREEAQHAMAVENQASPHHRKTGEN
ncbi:hypothetical protein HUX88_14600 [Duganella sp. BJB1802]|nr:hypothetical protein [Duganella sp. BJB1802]